MLLFIVIWKKIVSFIAMSCHGIIIAVGLESTSLCCFFNNKALLFIAKSFHGIINGMGLESASF